VFNRSGETRRKPGLFGRSPARKQILHGLIARDPLAAQLAARASIRHEATEVFGAGPGEGRRREDTPLRRGPPPCRRFPHQCVGSGSHPLQARRLWPGRLTRSGPKAMPVRGHGPAAGRLKLAAEIGEGWPPAAAASSRQGKSRCWNRQDGREAGWPASRSGCGADKSRGSYARAGRRGRREGRKARRGGSAGRKTFSHPGRVGVLEADVRNSSTIGCSQASCLAMPPKAATCGRRWNGLGTRWPVETRCRRWWARRGENANTRSRSTITSRPSCTGRSPSGHRGRC